MKVQDLKKYKTLDITELSGSPWNTAEKVLGLDENDKVVMAEPEEVVTPEYVDNAIGQAMETETARTESTYLKEHQSLEDYYTKEEVDQAIEDVEVDLSDYYTKAEVDEAIENVDVSDQLANYALISSVTKDINTAIANETARTENTYAKPSDIPSLDGYAKTSAVTQDIQAAIASETARTENVYAKKSEIPDLDNYYTKSETDEAIEEAISGISLEGYWTSAQTKNYVDAEITGATAFETARTESTYAKKSEIPSLDGYATENWVESQGYLTEHQSLDGYAKTTAVTQDIQSAIASETARTEDTYAKKSDIPDLDNYYTKAQTDAAITAATDDMATETWVQNQGYLTQHQDISGKLDASTFNTYTGATETVLEGKADISDIPDVSDFVTSGEVATQIDTAIAAETARTESTYLKEHQSLDGYATEQYVDNAIAAIPPVDLSAYAKTTAVTQDIQTAIAAETGRTEDAYIKKNLYSGDNGQYSSSITSIKKSVFNTGREKYDGIFNEYVVPTSGERGAGFTDVFVKKINGESIIETLSGILPKQNIELPTFSDVSTAITDSMQTETARTENVYAKKSEIPSLNGYATEDYVDSSVTAATATTTGWVESQGYLTQHQDISGKLDVSTFNTYTGATETVLEGKADLSDIPDVSDFVTSGDVATQIGTAMSVETARTESTYAKKSEIPSLDGYATESYVDTADAAATATTTGWVESQGYLTEHQDISGKLDVSVFTSYTGTTETAISGKVDKTDFNAYTGATETALSGKVSESTYSTYTASTASEIAGKQETLVSGTNIKTINNQSLLGNGNIDIQGGGGGGDNVVELTKAQYEALDPPAADTTYIITDAETVDLNDYAMASGLTELSGTVETLSTTVSGKADKANTTARNGYYIPVWNAQGIITGTYTQLYSKSQGINGAGYSVISTSSSSFPNIYAPTTVGTAGQPLLSNGSGAPSWGTYKFAFITQTQYDALSTKDATTIYFITGD